MEREDDVIDLLAIAQAIWKNIGFVLGSVLVGAALAFSYAQFLITPLYQAKAMLYVNNSAFSLGNASFSISSGELSAAQSLVDTYIVILKSRLTLNSVIKTADLPYTYEQLSKMVSAGAVNGTEIFEVTITDADPEEAELIANTIAKVLPAKISSIVEGSSVKIVDYAVVPAYPVSPSVTKYTILGFLAGGMLSCGIIVLIELMNRSIRDEDYLIQAYDLPILAVVPSMSAGTKGQSSGFSYYEPQKRRDS